MADNDAPRAGPVWTPGPWLAGFIKRTTIHCYIQNMKALGLVVSEKKIFLCFSHDAPGAGPVWTPGAGLAGFIKKTTIHCYTQNMNALGLVVSEKKIFFYVFPIVCLLYVSIYKGEYYTLVHTKYETSGPCGFGEEDFFIFFP